MLKNEVTDKVINIAVNMWQDRFGGTSSIEIADAIGLTNIEVMKIMEGLAAAGSASLNRNVPMSTISLPLDGKGMSFNAPVDCHIMFPSKAILEDAFYSSHLVRQNIPPFTAELMRGAHQLAPVTFREDVLARYFDHPELFEVNDSMSGGDIQNNPEIEVENYIYIRHGRRQLANGNSAVTVIYKDLNNLCPDDQRYWHGFEIKNPETAAEDPNFGKWVARTYDGSWVDFEAPIKSISTVIKSCNDVLKDLIVFNKITNIHLRPPVENTEKAFCDACSELCKIVGFDNLKINTLKSVAESIDGTDNFTHPSGKAMSTKQVLQLLEPKICYEQLSAVMVSIADFRQIADHRFLEATIHKRNFSTEFDEICAKAVDAIEGFSSALKDTAGCK